ncbi:hypothetical protein [Fictibacillus fluitans]|uniref:Uncharacterized protein n=1 Tax=Fictibacillus fluitans TaxID=3058422 RepID=A0ABT8HY16_9BACL|nr:hypothetical protein [Fictibacillus sp. NE201]MDN4525365.1 hypothetical protein [Fictibacillus sp. NE201]
METKLGIKHEHILNKSLKEIHKSEYLERQGYYQKAWSGEEVIYKVKCSLNSDQSYINVLSPIKENGKVIMLLVHVVPFELIPEKLQKAA